MENKIELRFTPSSEAGSAFEELHAINRMSGDAMTMDEIRMNRSNKPSPLW